jgi:phosphotransacetylase
LFIADAAVNVAPKLRVKRDITQNAIDCAHATGIVTPKHRCALGDRNRE